MKKNTMVLIMLLNLSVCVGVQGQSIDANRILEKIAHIRYPEPPMELELEMLNLNSDNDTTFYRMKVLCKDYKHVLVFFTYPARMKGQATLMLDNNMWLYMPNIRKSIRVSPHQLLSSGQISHGDIARMDLIGDYTPILIDTVSINGKKAFVLDLQAKDTKVAYKSIKCWAYTDNFQPIKMEFYSLSGMMLKEMHFTKYANMSGTIRPVETLMINSTNKKQRTLLRYQSIKKIKDLPDNMFTKRFLETK
jgi:hypothetical protein